MREERGVEAVEVEGWEEGVEEEKGMGVGGVGGRREERMEEDMSEEERKMARTRGQEMRTVEGVGEEGWEGVCEVEVDEVVVVVVVSVESRDCGGVSRGAEEEEEEEDEEEEEGSDCGRLVGGCGVVVGGAMTRPRAETKMLTDWSWKVQSGKVFSRK